MHAALAGRLDALLPQTQCTRCGYDGCRPYAEAMAAGTAAPNRCPPGGLTTLAALAGALAIAPPPAPDASCWPAGIALDADHALPPTIAVIDAERCIGCYKCVLACPVDAITGAPKFLHVVLEAECSGCELCLPPCPVDCISMAPRPAALPDAATQAPRWRARHDARLAQQAADRTQRDEARRKRREDSLKSRAQAYDIAAAIARARARRIPPP